MAGKRGKHGSRRQSTMSFSENVEVAETSYQMLEVLSFCDRETVQPPSLKVTELTGKLAGPDSATLSLKFQVVGYVQLGGGHWGVLETAKPKEKNHTKPQNRKKIRPKTAYKTVKN